MKSDGTPPETLITLALPKSPKYRSPLASKAKPAGGPTKRRGGRRHFDACRTVELADIHAAEVGHVQIPVRPEPQRTGRRVTTQRREQAGPLARVWRRQRETGVAVIEQNSRRCRDC